MVVKGLTDVKAIAASQVNSLALLSNGTVMDWGDNRDLQLGNGTANHSDVPVAVKGLSGVVAIAAGEFFNLALLSNGEVEAWGDDSLGQLGDGQSGSSGPVMVQGLSGVTQISAGDAFGLALLKAGTVEAWGDNSFDELGNPAAQGFSATPVAVQGIAHVQAIAGGGLSALALLSGGTVDSWGDDAVGQLGNGTTNDAAEPQPVSDLTSVTAIANGASHAIALGTGAGLSGGAPATTPWSTDLTPDPGAGSPEAVVDDSFIGVSAASADDAWAVGEGGSFPSTPTSAHWDGTAWTAVAMPQPAGGSTIVNGVDDVAPGNAWAVGTTTSSATDVERTVIEHWNGKSWTIVPSPNPDIGAAGNDALQAVASTSASDIWAVGQDFENINGGMIFLLLEHFNGTTWTAVASPASTGFDFANAVTAISPTNAWAVGSNANQTTLAAHWNGKRWTIVPTPSPMDGASPTNTLTGVSAAGAKDVWASGYEANVDDQNFRKPYLLHWNGSTWTLVPAPNAGTEGSLLSGIVALAPTDIWAVGQTQQDDGAIHSLTDQFNGHTWSTIPSPDPGQNGPTVDNSLASVASPGGQLVWAVGAQSTLGTCCERTFALRNPSG